MKKITLLRNLIVALVFLTASVNMLAQVTISQVYGGGGNTGATYKNDFVELYNKGNAAVTLSGWSIQYAGATSTFSTSNTYTIPTGTTIQPGKYLLIQCAAGTGGTTDLPTPELVSTLALGGTNGKVALCNNATPLVAADFTAASPTGASIVDFIGFGTANQYEGTAACAALSNTTAAIRAGNGATDTNNNSTDFSTGAPTPRNGSYSANSAAAPTANPGAGNYITAQSVTLSSATANAKIYYTTDGTVPDNTKTLYQTPISISATTTLKAIAYDANNSNPSMVVSTIYTFPTEVANIGALRANTTGFYKLTGEAIVTFKTADRNGKYIQDATGGVLIDDFNGTITSTYNVGDGIKGLIGSIALYSGMLQFTPAADPGAAFSTNNNVTPVEVAITDLATHVAQLVKVKNVTIKETGTFAEKVNYTIESGASSAVLRTAYTDLPYEGQTIVNTPQDITGVVLLYNSTPQLVPRSVADMIPAGVFTPKTEALNVWKSNGSINFNALEGETVEVYNAVGQRLMSQATVEGLNSLKVDNKGLTIVKIANRVGKIML